MDLNELHATQDAIIENAHDLEMAMSEFIGAQNAILQWFEDRNLVLTQYMIQLPRNGSKLRIVLTFDNDALMPFVAVEESFWKFIRELMPLDTSSHADVGLPFRSAEFREMSWDVIVVPDLCSESCQFPGIEYWESQARNEDFREKESADLIRERRISEALIGLVMAA